MNKKNYYIRQFIKGVQSHLIDRWWQVRGPAFKNPPIPPAVSSIVFICKGNICRSAFAHYLSLETLHNHAEPFALQVASAGLAARLGSASPAMAVEAAKAFAIDMQAHRSRPLNGDMAGAADMLIAMEPGQVRAMQRQYPHKRRNLFLLPLFADGWDRRYYGWRRYHIQDPYGKGRDDFLESFERVREGVEGLVGRLVKLRKLEEIRGKRGK
jgi:protein-tyrosine phosphatase